jgi:toxin ParE1/3/4
VTTPVSRTEQAERAELDVEIMAFIAEDSPRAAVRVVYEIRNAASRLALFSMLGRAGRVDGTRERIVPRTPYVIAYRFAASEVTLLHISTALGTGPQNSRSHRLRNRCPQPVPMSRLRRVGAACVFSA